MGYLGNWAYVGKVHADCFKHLSQGGALGRVQAGQHFIFKAAQAIAHLVDQLAAAICQEDEPGAAISRVAAAFEQVRGLLGGASGAVGGGLANAFATLQGAVTPLIPVVEAVGRSVVENLVTNFRFLTDQVLPPVVSSLSVMFIPVLGTFSGAWMLGETPQWQDYVAMIAILGAMSTVLFKPRAASAGTEQVPD